MERECFGLEGNSYMGKTTTLELLSEMQECHGNVVVGIPEYSNLATIPAFRREDRSDILKIVNFFLNLERERTDLVNNAITATNQNTVVLFDRTPISLILFEVAIGRTNQGRHATEELSAEFQRAIEDGEIIVPSQIVHLTSTQATFDERRREDLKKGKGDCIPLLLDRITRAIFDKGIRLWGEGIVQQSCHCIHVEHMDEITVAQKVVAILTANSTYNETEIDLVSFKNAVLALDIR